MLKGVLLFLAGALVGANATYYLMTRDRVPPPTLQAPAPAAGAAASAAGGEAATAVPPAVTTPRALPAGRPGASGWPAPAPATAAGTAAATAPVLPGGLLLPVQGIAPAQLSDTFTDARSEGRSHEAIDIMAPRGTPVLAVADGTVEKLFDSKQGGLTLYQFEPTGRYAYYYAHLDRYADGVVEHKPLRRGEVIGYVGSTGNADPTAPHLHFAVFVLGPERRWWQGTAINPYPLLTAR